MAKTIKIAGTDWDAMAFNLTEESVVRMRKVFEATIREALRIYASINNPAIPFQFSHYPKLKDRVNKLFARMASDLKVGVDRSTREAWLLSMRKNDALVREIAEKTGLALNKLGYVGSRNPDLLEAFQSRKESGMNLSARVWETTKQAKSEIEQAIEGGLSRGDSAQVISRALRSNLREPERLYRRVRDANGNLHLSQRARQYNPGRGVYRSSFKNAMRIARTETNMAYRTADHDRWQTMPFVVGIQIRLSNNPNHCDLCASLAGKYPKDFKFRGWHPQCRCHAVPILVAPSEYGQAEQQLLNHEDQVLSSRREVTALPDQLNLWKRKNKEKAAQWSALPYFVSDNVTYFSGW